MVNDHSYILKFYNPFVGDQPAARKNQYNYVMDFMPLEGDFKSVTGFGDFYRIMPTIIDIMRDFYDKVEVHKFIFNPEKSKRGDHRRFNIFLQIIERNIPEGWEVKSSKFWNKITIITPKF